MAQINPTVGDVNKNTNKIIRLIKKYEGAADLIIFPELSIVGYPPEDLILRKRLIEEVNKKINIPLMKETSKFFCICLILYG